MRIGNSIKVGDKVIFAEFRDFGDRDPVGMVIGIRDGWMCKMFTIKFPDGRIRDDVYEDEVRPVR